MMTSDDKMGGWVKKGQNHDDVQGRNHGENLGATVPMHTAF